ncbi:hypothetical protein J437_LFUL002284, partial [Ladona fulva]
QGIPAFTCNSSSVIFSPSSFATLFKFFKEILPVSSSSNKRKAFIISSLVQEPLYTKANIINLPVPSLSTSEIIFLISSFFGSKPSALMATYNKKV